MDRNAIFWVARLLTGAMGAVLVFGAIRLLGRARAAATWPTAAQVAPLAHPIGWTGIGAGLLCLAAATGSSLAALISPSVPALVPSGWRAWLIAVGAALVVFVMGGSTARRMLARAEVTALIRTPPRPGAPAPVPPPKTPAPRLPAQSPGDPAVPVDGRSGWVYRDPDGGWYLAVAIEGGQRLVRLTDFTLVPVGVAGTPLALAGSVEISVWPVTDAVPGGPVG